MKVRPAPSACACQIELDPLPAFPVVDYLIDEEW
jgi:hypothetical protein